MLSRSGLRMSDEWAPRRNNPGAPLVKLKGLVDQVKDCRGSGATGVAEALCDGTSLDRDIVRGALGRRAPALVVNLGSSDVAVPE